MNYVAAQHYDWHAATGTKSGPYGGGCPWDACGHAWADDAEREVLQQELEAEWAAAAPALREGETPAPLHRDHRPDAMDAPSPWDIDPSYDPPF